MDSSRENVLYLLGGADLEMLAIKEILEEHNIPYVDRVLSWGAKLSDYAEDWPVSGLVVGIELSKDCSLLPPLIYEEIDHHNENAHLPASIEQLATRLGIELTWDQQLIAANDKGYKPAMRAMGASEDEIQAIRLRDRAAQGVTSEMEEQAITDIANLIHDRGVAIVYTQLKRFSPIVDRLEEDRLIVYSDTELNYYGPNIPQLNEHYKDLIDANMAYSGGGSKGFFGLTRSYFEKQEAEMVIKEIIEITSGKFSTHIFLFPFKWKLKEFEDVNKVRELFEKSGDENISWKRRSFKVKNELEYNEFNYFYEFARVALYDMEEDILTLTNDKDENLLQHLELELDSNKESLFKISKLKSDQDIKADIDYTLNIKSVLLNIYDTGVGVLSYHLENYKHKDQQSILNINQFGRRLFPPFLDKKTNIDGSKIKNELANNISLVINGIPLKTEFYVCYKLLFKFNQRKERNPIKLPYQITELFPNLSLTTDYSLLNNDNVFVYPILDDRMFVISWYGNNHLSGLLKFNIENVYKSNFWYKYTFIDTYGKTCQNDKMQRQLIEKSSYLRWADWGSFYGISRYSLILLTGEKPPDFLITHINSIYYKMVELVIVQRATILNFSDRVADISFKNKNDTRELSDKLKKLYKEYMQFVNKIYFREVTAQEQGIEMYDKLQEQMMVDRDVKDLNSEIQELHNYMALLDDKELNRRLENLTILGAMFFVPSLIVGYYGMNFINPEVDFIPPFYFKWVSGAMIFAMIIPLIFLIMKNKEKMSFYRVIPFIGAIIIIISIILFPFFKGAIKDKPVIKEISTDSLLKQIDKNTEALEELKNTIENLNNSPNINANDKIQTDIQN